MSYPVRTPGFKFNLYTVSGGSGTFVCSATSVGLKESAETEDHMEQDCANPVALPQKVSIAKGVTWSISFSGRMEATTYQALRARIGVAADWRIAVDGTGAEGGGKYDGSAFLTELDASKSENGVVTLTGALNGQGLLAWTANA